MRIFSSLVFYGISLSLVVFSLNTAKADPTGSAGMKEWTFLVYLNGNNNLDSFGKLNMNQMEKVGSTKDINIVVQWASIKNKKTQRYYIVKDSDTNNVTSPVVQNLGKVDMGDWKSLVEFVKWGVANYPAKHYFIDVWDHGSGWHDLRARGEGPTRSLHAMDISWDDNSGNSITTEQLGMAMAESARAIGHKVDLYASDACLMAMAEVANEMSDSVSIFGGSEETEPGAGWAYDEFLTKWAAIPNSTPAQVAGMLTETYVASYSGGSNGTNDATFAVFDLGKMDVLNHAVANLGQNISHLDATAKAALVKSIDSTQSFTYSDYVDLGDFIKVSGNLQGLEKGALDETLSAMNQFVLAHAETDNYKKSTGLSIWMPSSKSTFDSYAARYMTLKFNQNTHWGEALRDLLQ